MIIKNCLVFTPKFQFKKQNIQIKDGLIIKVDTDDIVRESSEEIIDGEGNYLIPGLTDLHFHGCVGYDFCDGTDEAISEMAKFQFKKGVTNICPATMTLPKERLVEICKTAASHQAGYDEADLCGINLEGPFISPNRVGAQNPDYVQKANAEMIKDLLEASNGFTKLITIAPEEDGALECISLMKDKIRFSLGHTMSDYETAMKAFSLGAKQVTHMYNAMPSFNHRCPGVVGAAADNEDVMVELICDGIHLHPSVIRNTFKMFGDGRIILISDSMRACGMEDGEYELGGLPLFKKGSYATLKDGTLAGSVTNLFDCMINVINMGVPKEQAIKAATYNPAKALGILERCGTIEVGKEAKLVLLSDKYEIKKVIG
jgi:N-acetylglucosamine-6-phosphate deacetylase